MCKKAKYQKILLLAVFIILLVVPSICGANQYSKNGTAANQPWNEGINTMYDWVTGPLPTAVGGISLAAYLIMLGTGHNGGVATRVLQIVMAVSGAIKAPELISFIASSSGTLFQ